MYNNKLVYQVVIWAFFGISLWNEKVALRDTVCQFRVDYVHLLKAQNQWNWHIAAVVDIMSSTIDSAIIASSPFIIHLLNNRYQLIWKWQAIVNFLWHSVHIMECPFVNECPVLIEFVLQMVSLNFSQLPIEEHFGQLCKYKRVCWCISCERILS